MPTAIAGFLITTIGATGLAATLITAVVTIGFTVGTSLLVSAIFGPGRPKPSDGQQEVREAIGSRYRSYGIVHSSGQLSFLESREGTLAKVITLDTCRTSEILEHRINDTPVTVDVAGTVTDASYHGAVHIYVRNGEPDQTAIAELTAKFPEWTADHRQRGCSHVALIGDPVKQKLFSEVYNNRVPEYSQVRKAAPVYDPRKDDTAVIGFDLTGDSIYGSGTHRIDDEQTWSWDDNGALVTANYWAHSDGYGGGYDNVNWTNIAQEADHAAEEVITVDAETIARWRIWARYALASEERRAILTSMLQAIDGFCWQDANGKFNLICGRWEEPTVVITDDHILSMTAVLGPNAQERVSAIKVLYTEAAIGYKEQESNTVSVPGAEEDPNTDPQAVQGYYIPHHNQAVRAGKIIANQLAEDRWHLTQMLNLYGLDLIGERFCRVESAQLGMSGYFKIGGLKLHLAAEPPTVEVKSLDEVKPEDWNFDAAIEEGTPPNGTQAPPPDITIEVPDNVSLTMVQISLANATGVGIRASWDAPTRADLTAQAQYRQVGATAWIEMQISQDDNTAISGIVSTDLSYEVQVRFMTLTGRPSDWSGPDTITPSASALSLDFENGIYRTGASFAASLAAMAGYAYSRTGAKEELNASGAPSSFAADVPGAIAGFAYYSRAAATNQLIRSQAFDQWTASNLTITADALAAPDGTTTADKLAETAVNGGHQVSKAPTLTLVPYCFSVFAKAAERSAILLYNGAGGRYFNLATGTIGGVVGTAPTSAGIQACGGGWYRCWIVWTPATTTPLLEVYLSSTGANFSYAGTAGWGLYLWQAQAIAGSDPGPLITTAAATASTGADSLAVSLANGTYTATYTFDDDSTQDVPVTISAGAFTLAVHPTTLNRPAIRRVAVVIS